MEAEETDEFNAIARYLWNIALCEALYPTLQCFEVVLRNAIHDSLSMNYHPGWLREERKFRDYEWKAIMSAENTLTRLVREGKLRSDQATEPGRLVSQLTLGFWTGLFVRHYDKTFVAPIIRLALRGFPDPIRNRQTIYNNFERVRHMRNRVFHHEPIWYWQDLPQRHLDIVNCIGYINPTKQGLNGLLDRFKEVHSQGWEHYGTRITHEILQPKLRRGRY